MTGARILNLLRCSIGELVNTNAFVSDPGLPHSKLENVGLLLCPSIFYSE